MTRLSFYRYSILILFVISIIPSLVFSQKSAEWKKYQKYTTLFEDFENGTYGTWSVEGNAFGTEPRTGTSPRQQSVTGFLGQRLVNSYYPNDTTQGKLISKKFRINKPFIYFLLGGGNHPYETCINLTIETTLVRTQTGKDSEYLSPYHWDVHEFMGKDAQLEIVDMNTTGWGHINIDQILFSDVELPDDYFLPYDVFVKAGDFLKIYDPSVGEKEPWYINDHAFIYGNDSLWHLFGITHQEPAKPLDEDNFAHAVSSTLTQETWQKLPFALSVDSNWMETHLWAPSVISHNGTYYIFYCAGGTTRQYRIHLATSTDLNTWERSTENPLFMDGCHARDPNVMKLNDEFIMYYTATDPADWGNHIVAYRTSKDLIHWSDKNVCFRDSKLGCGGGETESPFVVRRGKYYYLFIGPRGEYAGTDVFRSTNPFHWELTDQVGHIQSHALEVIRDLDGKWYVSHCGWGEGGVYIAPLNWLDGVDENDTSIPIPR